MEFKLFLSPHNDDETLFASFSIIRERPLVIIVTDGYLHIAKGVTPEERRQESIRAMNILGIPIVFLGLRDDDLKEEDLILRLSILQPDRVYAPAVYDNGNLQHNLVGRVALQLWSNRVMKYATYRLDDLELRGDIEISPTKKELDLKNLALDQYKSQLILNKQHFDAVRGKSEYLVI